MADWRCMECDEDAVFRCLRCQELTCREHLSNHRSEGCPGDQEDEDQCE